MKAIYKYDGPIGPYLVQETDGALTRIWVGNRLERVSHDGEWQETPLLAEADRQLKAYFERRLTCFDLPWRLEGTPFQLKIWRLLQEIPYGTVITYGELARRSGDEKACRAVGMANGRNPLPILIPCHRVIGAHGKLTGYTGGLSVKVALLRVEGWQVSPDERTLLRVAASQRHLLG